VWDLKTYGRRPTDGCTEDIDFLAAISKVQWIAAENEK
jgi:hypothetical protein